MSKEAPPRGKSLDAHPSSTTSPNKKDPEREEFWLTTTVEMGAPDFSLEVTGVKLYMKWNMYKPRLFETPDAELFQKQLRKMLRFDDAFFPKDDHERKDYAIKKLAQGGFKAKGCYLNSLDDGTFPVNPGSVIKNEVPGSQKILSHLCWVELHPENKAIACQLTITVDAYTRFNMINFPFDQHVIPLALQIKQPWKEDGKKHVWVFARNKPKWAPAGWKGKDKPEDLVHVVENTANVDPASEINHLFPRMYFTKKKEEEGPEKQVPVICMRIYRDPTNVIFSVTGPVCCIGLMSMGSFFLGFNNADDRLTKLSLAVLALAAYKTALTHMIPQKSYLTLADKYLFFGFAFFAALGTKVVIAFQGLSNSGVGFFWYDGPSENDDDGDENDDWDRLSPTYQMIDDATSLFALGLWTFVHVLLVFDCVQRAFFRPCEECEVGKDEVVETFLDKFLRKKWSALYEEEAERTNYTTTFEGKKAKVPKEGQ